jgi:hypothetical protein
VAVGVLLQLLWGGKARSSVVTLRSQLSQDKTTVICQDLPNLLLCNPFNRSRTKKETLRSAKLLEAFTIQLSTVLTLSRIASCLITLTISKPATLTLRSRIVKMAQESSTIPDKEFRETQR